MKQSPEQELDLIIDSLNQERKPQQELDKEAAELLAVVRTVKKLGQPKEPHPEFAQRISHTIRRRSSRRWITIPAAALVAGLLLVTMLINWNALFTGDPVYAMEKAVAKLSDYHGMLEMRSRNAAGEEWTVRQVELWSEGDKYAIRQNDGVLTVNNGEQKWQVRPQSREVALLPVAPDPAGKGFDLRDEAKRAMKYPNRVTGNEIIAGRQAIKLKISPPGGLPYYLWIDTKTDLPIQLQTAMQNALQTTYTFVSFTPNTGIDPDIFAYRPPEGYRVVENDPGQQVATVAEAAAISRLTPALPEEAPERIFAFTDRIVMDYGETTIVETVAKGAFEPTANSALGTAAGGPLEVWYERLRWRQDGIEIEIEGSKRAALAKQIAGELTLPNTAVSLTENAAVKIPVDMDIVRADQQQVDGGHTPWQLDPLQVSLTFVNLLITPEGITGEPTIPYGSFKLKANNGAEAVVTVGAGPVKQVYLKRLIRQDETGIWSVVGYDPRK